MMNLSHILNRNMRLTLCAAAIFAAAVPVVYADNAGNADDQPYTTKRERNLIREGNTAYKEKRFADAEVLYRKALEEVPSSETARFNLAASLIRQGGSADPNSGNNPLKAATEILQQLAKDAADINIAEKAYYNLGNMAFNNQDYASSIELYKNALRKVPGDDRARENLRLAQLKRQEQQDQQQNQQNQDQQQQQQDQQQQNQDQQQQQNQDQQQNQNQDQQQQQQDQQQKDKDKKPEQQQGISDANAEKILKAMENEEAATRKRVEAQKKKDANARRKRITNPW